MFCFPKKARISKKGDFDCLKGRGVCSARTRHFEMHWIPREERRLGIVISRRVGLAHERNRIKRIIREVFRLKREQFPFGDVLIIVRARLGGIRKESIRHLLSELLRRGEK